MDKTEMSLSDRKDAPNEPVSMQCDTENPSTSQDFVTPDDNQASSTKFAPKLKPFCEERRENFDNYEVEDEDKDPSISDKTIQKLSEIKIDDHALSLKPDGNQRGKNPRSESSVRSLEDPMETAAVPADQHLKKSASGSTTAATESAMTPNSEKRVGKVSVAKTGISEVAVRNTRGIKRQRIVYNEKSEMMRGFLLEHIKDREILLKFQIMEGRYSTDMETKMKCIEEAKRLQMEIDEHFGYLEDNDKMANSPKRFKGNNFKSDEEDSSDTEKKSKQDSLPEEDEINSCSTLFQPMYKFSSYEYKNESVFKIINLTKFICAWNSYLVSKKKIDRDSDLPKYAAKSATEDLISALVRSRSVVKCKIPPPKNRSLEDYLNYVNDLKMAVDENLVCLDELLPIITEMIFPFFRLLHQSRKKIINIFSFLNEERPDVFRKKVPKTRAFFENFCKQHFKINF